MTSEVAFSGSGRGEVTGIQNFFFKDFFNYLEVAV